MTTTTIRAAIVAALNAEFVVELPDGFESARLAASSGIDGARGGVTSDGWAETPSDVNMVEYAFTVEYHDWVDMSDLDPTDAPVDVGIIELIAERLTSALRAAAASLTGTMLRVRSVTLIDDPQQNRTRLSARVTCFDRNPFYP